MISITERNIKVFSGSTDDAIASVEKLIRGGILYPQVFTSCEIRYDKKKGIACDTESPEAYPVKFKGGQLSLWVSGCSAGYGGTGPHGTLQVLKIMGFNVSTCEEAVILGNQGYDDDVVDLILYK